MEVLVREVLMEVAGLGRYNVIRRVIVRDPNKAIDIREQSICGGFG